MSKKLFFAISAFIVFIVLCATITSIVEDVPTNKTIVSQAALTGNVRVWSTPGLKLQMFGSITEYDKATVYYFSNLKNEGGSQNTAIAIKYNDGSIGSVSGTVMIKLPVDNRMKLIQDECSSMEGVINKIIIPKLNEVIFMSGGFMSPFEAYATKRNNLIDYINDQLKYGVYRTVTSEQNIVDEITGEKKVINISKRVTNPEAPNGYERTSISTFDYFGLDVKLSISDFDFSDTVKAQIAQQQKSNMSIESAKIEALASQQRVLKEKAEGEANAEKSKWEQERIKIVEVTKAQQEYEVSVKQAEKQYQIAKLAALEADEKAKKILAEGKAEAEANKLKVSAGLSPQEAAEWKYKTTVGVAEAIAKSPQKWVPDIMVTSGDSKTGTNPLDAVSLKMLMDITDKMSK